LESGYIKDPQLREDILKVKVYRIFSYIFLAAGFFVFLVMYNNFIDGKSIHEIFSFTLLGIIILPFLPAMALSIVAHRTALKNKTALKNYYEEEAKRKAERIRAANENVLKAAQQQQQNIEQMLDPAAAAREEQLDAALEYIEGVGDDEPSERSGKG
tara:strand:+ start:220 stop:690 length:471 start_codon:yes stop_codon:yes gene_type:complete